MSIFLFFASDLKQIRITGMDGGIPLLGGGSRLLVQPSIAYRLAVDMCCAEGAVKAHLRQVHHPGMHDAVAAPLIAEAPEAVAVFAQVTAVGADEKAVGVGAVVVQHWQTV
ncbi:MAG: hypothetical protein BRC51_11430 [Cyanobacteria bacterium SW_12_48_29]|nr:MAG: hypothetical protein BRC51_11430 [Cyanobacteria bacterium SW_12_48_29]